MNSSLLKEFLTHINENSLFGVGSRLLLAVSGGKDSMAMADLFLKAKLVDFGIAHCNFQLRGQEANDDADFVRQYAINQGIKFHTISFDTKAFAKENGLSTQLAARQLRYDWFEAVRVAFQYDFIITAHHLNDVIETTLLNITKGTGLAGLHGIPAKNGYVIRPLLFATRQSIDAYVAENNIIWREDASNAHNDYQRNLIRNEVIPLLKQINPNLEHTFKRNTMRWASAETMLAKLNPLEIIEDVHSTKIALHSIQDFYALETFLKPFGFNYMQANNIYKSLTAQSGKIFYSSDYELIKDRQYLIITLKKPLNLLEILIETDTTTVKLVDFIVNFSIKPAFASFDEQGQYLSYDALTFPLKLRIWQSGDYFIPAGMKGRKKISDFLIDKKIPLSEKKNTWVILSNNIIVCVLGHRLDESYKCNDHTQKALCISIDK